MSTNNCIIETEFALRIIIPVCNTLIGILTFIATDDLLDDNGKYQVHIATAVVNILLMLLALVNELLKNNFESQKTNQSLNYNGKLSTFRSENPIYVKQSKNVFWKNLIPFQIKLH